MAFLALCWALPCPPPTPKKKEHGCFVKVNSYHNGYSGNHAIVTYFFFTTVYCFFDSLIKNSNENNKTMVFHNDLGISMVTVSMAICNVNTNMKCNKYELV